ncbi:MAG: hypothetical protein ACRCZ2_04155 [Fusobacteriaceae bacterium]
MRPMINTLKKYTLNDPEFVMEVITFVLDKNKGKAKTTTVVSAKMVFKILSYVDEVSSPAIKEMFPEAGERSIRHKAAACRLAIKAVS